MLTINLGVILLSLGMFMLGMAVMRTLNMLQKLKYAVPATPARKDLTLIEEVGQAASARNAAAGDHMYHALHTISNELRNPEPNLTYIRHIVMRAIPRGL